MSQGSPLTLTRSRSILSPDKSLEINRNGMITFLSHDQSKMVMNFTSLKLLDGSRNELAIVNLDNFILLSEDQQGGNHSLQTEIVYGKAQLINSRSSANGVHYFMSTSVSFEGNIRFNVKIVAIRVVKPGNAGPLSNQGIQVSNDDLKFHIELQCKDFEKLAAMNVQYFAIDLQLCPNTTPIMVKQTNSNCFHVGEVSGLYFPGTTYAFNETKEELEIRTNNITYAGKSNKLLIQNDVEVSLSSRNGKDTFSVQFAKSRKVIHDSFFIRVGGANEAELISVENERRKKNTVARKMMKSFLK